MQRVLPQGSKRKYPSAGESHHLKTSTYVEESSAATANGLSCLLIFIIHYGDIAVQSVCTFSRSIPANDLSKPCAIKWGAGA